MTSESIIGARRPAVALWLALSLVPSIASADLDEAQRLFREEANFVDALAELDEAAAGDALSREELVDLLVLRAVIHAALRDEAARDRALAMLRALAPDHDFAPWVPPQVSQRFVELPRGDAPEVHARLEDSRVEVSLAHEGELVRGVRVHWRSGARGEWSSAEGASAEVPSGPVEFYAEAIGPGGAVIASAGSRRAPLRGGLAPEEAIRTLPAEEPVPSDDTLSHVGIVIGVSAAIAAAVGIVLAVVLTSSGSATHPFAPMEVAP